MAETKKPAATKTRPRADLAQMLMDLEGVPSIELKMNVERQQAMAVRQALARDLDVMQGSLRECCFFDTPDLDLFSHGVVVRARRTQGKDDDTAIKLRPAGPKDLSPAVLASSNLKIEMDVTTTSYVISSALRGVRPAGAVRATLHEGKSLEKLFSKEQRAFYAEHAPEGIGWADLKPIGPILVVFIKYYPEGFPVRMTVEQWHYPGDLPVVELSFKTTRSGLLDVVPAARTWFEDRGIELTPHGKQEPKTRKALEFFSKALQEAAAK